MAKIKTKARAVDMLGRQQIAGIQNAISELFKNAHDAYAAVARIDYFEAQKLLLVRDDGVGMTMEDFTDKWLVLGTDSKFGEASQNQYRPLDMPVRPITGEKGIGRLAIALLGRIVLVLSRARRANGVSNMVVGLVHWGLFELPGLNLDEIDLPLVAISGGKLPTSDDCIKLTAKLGECVDRLAEKHSTLSFAQIKRELKAFRPDPVDLEQVLQPHDEVSLSLAGEGTGTHFIIAPATSILDLEISGEQRTQDYSFRKSLLGFYNQVFLASPPPVITTSFRHWPPGAATGTELLDPDLFFTTADMPRVDHQLTGEIDRFGQFLGTLRVYEKTYTDLPISWKEGAGQPTECGPFQIVFGYIMGTKSESRLTPEEWDDINAKLERLGGMYIYRDGIRVLPYGDHSVDWLEVEKRRNLGAGYYFFSFRRMFGAVILSRHDNGALVEKAGREGWQQNSAYRQLRDIVMNLLKQLAAEFFRKGGTYTDVFEDHQAALKRQAALLEKREKQVSTKRKKFSAALDRFFDTLSSNRIAQDLSSLRQQTKAALQAAAALPDHDQAAAALIRAEKTAMESVQGMRDSLICRRPAGVGLSKPLQERWSAYQSERSRIEHEHFTPFELETAESLGKLARQAKVYINQRRRLEERLKAVQTERQKMLREAVEDARRTADATRNAVFGVTQRAVESFDLAYRQIEADLGRRNLDELDENQIEALRRRWEEQLLDVEERHRASLEAARDMLSSLATNLENSGGSEPAEIMEAMDERISALEEQADDDFEMVQLGLAVAIINHEFGAAIANVRRSIQDLGFLARGSKGIKPLYESIRANFEHLDGHLGLFTPLQRRLHRRALPISGQSIHRYINDLFSNRLTRHNVKVEPTDAFLRCSLECYPSTVYPVFINLVDNAIYWLKTVNTQRTIQLDAVQGAMIIANNGPAIPSRDAVGLFERGFTRKSGGRGLGLFIGKRALQKEQMDIILDVPPPGFNVAFRVTAPTLRLT